MHVIVNGASLELNATSTVEQMLQQLELGAGRIAVEINGEIVPRSRFGESLLQEGDIVEIVQAIGGG